MALQMSGGRGRQELSWTFWIRTRQRYLERETTKLKLLKPSQLNESAEVYPLHHNIYPELKESDCSGRRKQQIATDPWHRLSPENDNAGQAAGKQNAGFHVYKDLYVPGSESLMTRWSIKTAWATVHGWREYSQTLS